MKKYLPLFVIAIVPLLLGFWAGYGYNHDAEDRITKKESPLFEEALFQEIGRAHV